MASLAFFCGKRRATRCEQPKEESTNSQSSSVRSERRTLENEDCSTDEESLVLILSPEESLEVLAPQPSTQAAEKRNETEPDITSSGALFYGWEELSSPTQHPSHDEDDLHAMMMGVTAFSSHPTEAQDSASSLLTRSRTGYPDAWLEPQELDPMSSGTVFKSQADLRDPGYLTRRSRRQEDDGLEVDDLDLMSGGVMFRSVEDLRDPAALRKIALARADTR